MLGESLKPESPLEHGIATAQWRQMHYWKQERTYVADQYEAYLDEAEESAPTPHRARKPSRRPATCSRILAFPRDAKPSETQADECRRRPLF